MKFLALSLLFLSLPAMAEDRMVSFSELVEVSQKTAKVFSDDESCSFIAKNNGDQLRVSIAVDQEEMVILNIPAFAKITSDAQQEFDGSYQYSYTIPGHGKLTLTHLDDAMDRVDLSDGAYSVNCEIQL